MNPELPTGTRWLGIDPDNELRRPSDLRSVPPRRSSRRRGPAATLAGFEDQTRTVGWPEGFSATPEDRAALLVLSGLATLTPTRLLELAADEGSAAACLAAVRAGRGASVADQKRAATTDAEEVERALTKVGGRLVVVGDDEYPPPLLDLFDPPAALYVRGVPLWTSGEEEPGSSASSTTLEGALSEERFGVAIVGARTCSGGGVEMTTLLARGLARAGLCVVSGGARGIDAAAHRGAVEAGGRSVAVLGSGIDALYPRRNAPLLLSLTERGCIVSEYPPGVPAEPFRFPARNRLVAALAAATVVVEGTAGSGALITADHAAELGREVFAVPGPVSSALASAPLGLLRDGARLIRGADDLLEDLGVPSSAPNASASATRFADAPGPEGLAGRVLAALAGPTEPGQLAAMLGAPLPEVLAALVRLELGGLVRRVGGRFERRTASEGRVR